MAEPVGMFDDQADPRSFRAEGDPRLVANFEGHARSVRKAQRFIERRNRSEETGERNYKRHHAPHSHGGRWWHRFKDWFLTPAEPLRPASPERCVVHGITGCIVKTKYCPQ